MQVSQSSFVGDSASSSGVVKMSASAECPHPPWLCCLAARVATPCILYPLAARALDARSHTSLRASLPAEDVQGRLRGVQRLANPPPQGPRLSSSCIGVAADARLCALRVL